MTTDAKTLDDRLSPILIKELRQGMRARAFIISFLLIQVFLVVLVLGNLAAAGDHNVLDTQNSFFWVIVGFALLFLNPFRGLVAISQEVRRNTLETILLTRMTAWRVVFGKWSALFAQSLLFVSALLPYVVLRYFIGGDDVVSDFSWLLFMLWLSGMLSAVSIAVSALGNLIVRIILIVVAAPTAISLIEADFLGTGYAHLTIWENLGWLAVYGFFVPALLFELAATSIAPASENHAGRRRLLALLFFIVSCALAYALGDTRGPGAAIPLIILVGICYFELAEKPRLIPRLVQQLQRFGWAGRIIGLFFLPGWPSALIFSLAVLPAGLAFLFHFTHPSGPPTLLSLLLAIFGSGLVPIAACHLLWPKMNQVALMIALYNIILLALGSLLSGFASLIHSKVNDVLAFLPGLPVLLTNSENTANRIPLDLFLTGNAITLALVLLALLFASRTYFRNLFALFRAEEIKDPVAAS